MSTEYSIHQEGLFDLQLAEASAKLKLQLVEQVGIEYLTQELTGYITPVEMAAKAIYMLQCCGYSMTQEEWKATLAKVNELVT